MTDLADLSAESLLEGYAGGRFTPVDALDAVQARIARDNPSLNAFAVMDDRAGQAAADSALRWRAGRPIGALDGVPCTVKDLIDLAGLPTRRGSRTTSPDPAADDAPIVVSLKSEGAVIVGKTTTTEFGWKTPGDCPLHGITRNPRDPAYTTGGSSSGAGAAGAAGFGPLHVGTDAGGSVRIPAAWCGLVGLKPSFGRIPQWPLGAFASVAVAGPMTRTVRDNALMFGALARWDARDPYCQKHRPRDWRRGIEDGVAGMRVGILRRPGFDAPLDADGAAALEEAAALLRAHGAIVEDVAPDLPDSSELFTELWSTALKLVVRNTPPALRGQLDPGLHEVAAMPAMSAIDLMEATVRQNQAAHAMAMLHLRHPIVLCPTVPIPPPRADAPLDAPAAKLVSDWAPWTFLFNLTRQPAITVPLGTGAAGLPRSIQLAAAQGQDDLLFRAARTVERAWEAPR